MAGEIYPTREKRWVTTDKDWPAVWSLSRSAGVSFELAQICQNRGLHSPQEIAGFLSCREDGFFDPFLFPGMAKAVQEITSAMAQEQKILIYGDYDVDGITATSLLYLYLNSIGASVDYYIPSRIEEGYGLNDEAIRWAAAEGFRLIITVDCGITAIDQVHLANQLGLRMVITDHHQPRTDLPAAAALINPKIPGCDYPGADLAGVGVAWKLAQGIHRHREGIPPGPGLYLKDYLDLVSLGTVADVVSLTGENRLIVKLGLQMMNQPGLRPGLKALLAEGGWTDKTVGESQLGFLLAPRLNAAGRLSSARNGVELLISGDPGRCQEIARELNGENTQRQAVEKHIFAEASQMMLDQPERQEDWLLVLASAEWHPGVIGIVASRLMEKYHRPTILLSIDGDTAKGSGRSIAGLDLYQALENSQDLLLQFGGHKLAAGLKIHTADIEQLRVQLNRWAKKVLREEDLLPTLKIDVDRGIDGSEAALIDDLQRLAPFGQGNPRPVFIMRRLLVAEARAIGTAGVHLKMELVANSRKFAAIGFNLGGEKAWLFPDTAVDIACTLEMNQWNGRSTLQFVIKDIQPAGQTPDLSGVGPADSETAVCRAASNGKIQPAIVDARRNHGEWSYLSKTLSDSAAALIYLQSRQQSRELMFYLEAQGCQLMSVCCGQGQSAWQQAAIVEQAGCGEINAVVTSEALPPGLPPVFQDLILFDCPASQEEFAQLAGLLAENGRIHLCYSAAPVNSQQAVDGEAFPDREELGNIYRVIRHLEKSAVPLQKQNIIQRCREAGLADLAEETLRFALEIFADLKLTRDSGSGRMTTVKLIEPAGKVILEDSPVFQAGQLHKKRCRQWRQLAQAADFTAAVDKLWQ